MKWQQTLSSTNQNVLVSQMNHQKPWTTLMSVTSRCHWNIFPYPGHVLRARVILFWENWVALWLCLWSEVSNFLRWNKTSTCSCSWLLQELLSILRPFVREDTFLFFWCHDRNCHNGLKWYTAVEQNRFSIRTNTIIHGRFLFLGSSCEPLSPPLAISTNKHFPPPTLYKKTYNYL